MRCSFSCTCWARISCSRVCCGTRLPRPAHPACIPNAAAPACSNVAATTRTATHTTAPAVSAPAPAAMSSEADVAAVVASLTRHPSLRQVLLPSLDGHRRWVGWSQWLACKLIDREQKGFERGGWACITWVRGERRCCAVLDSGPQQCALQAMLLSAPVCPIPPARYIAPQPAVHCRLECADWHLARPAPGGA